MSKLLFILLLLPAAAFSQKDSTKYFKDTIVYSPVPIDSAGSIVFKHIYDAPNTPKSELYARAKIWTALTFLSAKNAIQLDDQDKISLIIKGVQESENNLWFTIQFTFKDNKYRVILSRFWIERSEIAGYSAVTKESTKEFVKYYPDAEYKELCEYNANVKFGSADFNDSIGHSKHREKVNATHVQLVSDFARSELQAIQKAMEKSARGDDF
jgi:hypothetical protein